MIEIVVIGLCLAALVIGVSVYAKKVEQHNINAKELRFGNW